MKNDYENDLVFLRKACTYELCTVQRPVNGVNFDIMLTIREKVQKTLHITLTFDTPETSSQTIVFTVLLQNGGRVDWPESSSRMKTSPKDRERLEEMRLNTLAHYQVKQHFLAAAPLCCANLQMLVACWTKIEMLFFIVLVFHLRWQMGLWWLWFRSKYPLTTSPTPSRSLALSVDMVSLSLGSLYATQSSAWAMFVYYIIDSSSILCHATCRMFGSNGNIKIFSPAIQWNNCRLCFKT